MGHARTRNRSTSTACIPYAAAKFSDFSRPLTTPNAPFVFLTGSVHATARNNAFTLVEWTDPVRKTKGAFGVVRGREKVQKGVQKNALRSISPQGVSLTSPSHPRHPQKNPRNPCSLTSPSYLRHPQKNPRNPRSLHRARRLENPVPANAFPEIPVFRREPDKQRFAHDMVFGHITPDA